MKLCESLLDDFKKSTIKELKKKGMVVTDSDGKQVTNVDELLGEWSNVKRKKSIVPEKEFQCKARVWNDGYGAQCTKTRNGESDYCTQHENHNKKYGRLMYGRWKGTRYLRYPDNFGRRSKTVIKWKGKDVSYQSPTRKTQKKVRKSSSIKRSSAAKRIQAQRRGQLARRRKTNKKQSSKKQSSKKQSSKKKSSKPSPGFFKGIMDDIVGQAADKGNKVSIKRESSSF